MVSHPARTHAEVARRVEPLRCCAHPGSAGASAGWSDPHLWAQAEFQGCVCVCREWGGGGNNALEPRPVNCLVQLVTCRTWLQRYLLLSSPFFTDFGPTTTAVLPSCSLGSCGRVSASVYPALCRLPVALPNQAHSPRVVPSCPCGLQLFGALSLSKRFAFLIFILFLHNTCF